MFRKQGYVLVKPHGLLSVMVLDDLIEREHAYLRDVRLILGEDVYYKSLRFALQRCLPDAARLTLIGTQRIIKGYCLDTGDYVVYLPFIKGYYSLGLKQFVQRYRIEREIVITKTSRGNTNFLINANSSNYYYNTNTKRLIDERQKNMKHSEVGRLPFGDEIRECELPSGIAIFDSELEFIDWLLS
jgi:hypothetical protein